MDHLTNPHSLHKKPYQKILTLVCYTINFWLSINCKIRLFISVTVKMSKALSNNIFRCFSCVFLSLSINCKVKTLHNFCFLLLFLYTFFELMALALMTVVSGSSLSHTTPPRDVKNYTHCYI